MWESWQNILQSVGQEHLLAFVEQLDAASSQRLQAQLAAIDFAEFAQMRQRHFAPESTSAGPDFKSLAAQAEPPPALRIGDEPAKFTRQQARECGEAALRAGKIGMMLVAGGLGTRLGFDQPKGLFPLGPVSQRTLFQILIDKLRAVSKRFGTAIPLYIMTSPATHAVTARYMEQTQRCGLAADDLHLFEQGTMYAVDAQSFEILLAAPGEIFTGPDGHGGMLAALVKSGCLKAAQARGIEHFFYGQIDNPLLTVCDPEFLGCHILSGSELTTQAVAKVDPAEKVGVLASIGECTQIIEYVDLSPEQSRERLTNGTLKFWAGNTAVHAFSAAFLATMAASDTPLPFHISKKKVPFVNREGKLIEPPAPNAIRFERFIFDLLPLAKNPLVVEVSPADAFAPVKNDDTAATDSPRTSRAAMIAQATKLLQAAGAEIKDQVTVEVNPLWAYDADEARAKLPPHTTINQPTYFHDSI
jgi:UDP-N-acetylglucosamine/UDP-N-acetylgalactosamine diphosphorylase